MHDINLLLKKALSICDKENIPYGNITGISINNRLSKALGRCMRKGNTDNYSIELRNIIADDTITPEHGALEIILHEIIHTCKGCWNHGDLFNSYGARLAKHGYGTQGSTKNMDSLNLNMDNYIKAAKYICKCEKCGHIEVRQRKCKFTDEPQNFIHKSCGGSFIRVK